MKKAGWNDHVEKKDEPVFGAAGWLVANANGSVVSLVFKCAKCGSLQIDDGNTNAPETCTICDLNVRLEALEPRGQRG